MARCRKRRRVRPRFESCIPYLDLNEVLFRLTQSKHRHFLRREILALLRLGYKLRWCKMTAADYGVPQDRSCVVLMAAKDGLTLPDCHSKSHGSVEDVAEHSLKPVITVRQAIGDLEFNNPRADSDGDNLKFLSVPGIDVSPYVERMRQTQPHSQPPTGYITHHSTGRRLAPNKYSKLTPPKWDQTSRTVRTRPGNRWDSLHPSKSRFLSLWFRLIEHYFQTRKGCSLSAD